MDIFGFGAIVGAVIVANAVCFAFFMGAMKASKEQRDGAKSDALPLWVYPCLIAAPGLMAVGFALLSE
jgi:hypothetical protein